MPDTNNLLPRKRYFNAKDIDTFVNYELSRETSIIRRNSVNNVFSFSDKIAEERNACMKFCVYGMLQSKWFDCENFNVNVYISDSSTNTNADLNQRNPFWIYDKNSGISALTWSFNSRKLDSINGSLSKNIYYKNKASYFFPFEIDLNTLIKTDGILTNKSIYLESYDLNRFGNLNTEIPFMFFDDEGVMFDFGEQTAQILESGDILEINTDYPFLYDRHWIRQELNPTGPPYVFFTNDSMTIEEGGLNSDVLENKILPIEVSLSSPSVFGVERVKIEVVFEDDESGNPLTTIQFPSDALLNTDYLTWNFVGDSQVKYLYIRIQDDYFVEQVEKLTLRIIPIVGCVPDLNKPQIMTIYFIDNDIPSQVSFETSTISFTEPRYDVQSKIIPITLELDKRLLVDGQYLTVYIDENNTDCKSFFGFDAVNGSNSAFTQSTQFFFNKNDLTYTRDLQFVSTKRNDLQRKITLKMSGLTSNLIERSVVQNATAAQMIITVDKNLDKNFTNLLLPFNKSEGFGVLRNIYNSPNANYNQLGLGPTGLLTTTMAYPKYSSLGELTPNILLTNYQDVPQGNVKEVIYENDFDIEVTNDGDIITFDGKVYDKNESFTIQVRSGFTTNVSTNEFIYDGQNYVLRVPANSDFRAGVGVLNIQIPTVQDAGLGSWGYRNSKYKMKIKNLSLYPKLQSEFSNPDFLQTNELKQTIFQRVPNPNLAQAIANNQYYLYNESLTFEASENASQKAYTMLSRAIRVKSQIQYDDASSSITSFSGTTATYYPESLFYRGALILPKPYLFPSNSLPSTKTNSVSQIFFTRDVVLMENELINLPSSGNTLGGLFPVSSNILNEPVSAKTSYVSLYFGNLLIQNGYGTINVINAVIQNPATDAFILGINGQQFSNLLKPWSSASVSQKAGAVIEIINDGIIPAIIQGFTLDVGQKMYISETPIGSNSQGNLGNSGYINIVRPLSNIVLNLPTNYRYINSTSAQFNNQTINTIVDKFVEIRYRISFLNFNLTPTRVFNHTISLQKRVVNVIIGSQSTAINNLYLRTRYGANTLVYSELFSNSSCGPFGVNKFLKLSQVNRSGAEILGIIATASQDSPIVSSEFVEFDDLSTINICTRNGFSYSALN